MKSSLRVFISYRRRDNPYIAAELAQVLGRHFGNANIFLDVQAIPIGIDFLERINEQIEASDAVIVLIGSGWEPVRLEHSSDAVRWELVLAKKYGKTIVPVLHSDQRMPTVAELPSDLAWFSSINAFQLGGPERYKSDMSSLAKWLATASSSYETNPMRVRLVPGSFAIGINAMLDLLEQQTGIRCLVRFMDCHLSAHLGSSSVVLGQIIGIDGYDSEDAFKNPREYAEAYTGSKVRDAWVDPIYGQPGLRMELDGEDLITYLRSGYLALLISRCDAATTDAIARSVELYRPAEPQSISHQLIAPIPLVDGFQVSTEAIEFELIHPVSGDSLMSIRVDRDRNLDHLDDLAGATLLVPEGASLVEEFERQVFGRTGGRCTLSSLTKSGGGSIFILTAMIHIDGSARRLMIRHDASSQIKRRNSGLVPTAGFGELIQFLPYFVLRDQE